MIKKIAYITILLGLASCEGLSDTKSYNPVKKVQNYRYTKTAKNSNVHYNFKQGNVRYKSKNYSKSLFQRTGKSKYRKASEPYKQMDYADSSYSEGDYSLYQRPENYTGYYKIGNPYEIMGQEYCPMPAAANHQEQGVASWYGEKFYGKQTANGEIYNMHDLTAAHRTLPLPSIVRVTNLNNGRTIKLRVNDRGPFAKDRIIDVSKEAAQKLGFVNHGTTNVKVEYLPADTEKMLTNFGLK